MRDASEMERSCQAFARTPNGGLIVTPSETNDRASRTVIAFTASHKLPAIYLERFFVRDGGLISYGPNIIDQYRRAASYVDRILKGEKPAEPSGAGSNPIRDR